MKKNEYSLLTKVLFSILLLAMGVSFLLSRFITESGLIIICALAFVAAVSAENLKHGLSLALAFLVVVLEFLGILPSPYNFLFSLGLSMGPSIVLTLLVSAAYVTIPVWLVFWRFSKAKG